MDAPRTLAVVLVILALVGLAVFTAYRYQDRDGTLGIRPGTPSTPTSPSPNMPMPSTPPVSP